MAYLKSFGKGLIYMGVILVAITFIPGIPPDVKFAEYSVVSPKELQSPFSFNDKLKNPEILFSGQVKGPEAYASYNGELYTGVYGGYVVKITKDAIVPIVKFGNECDGIWQESKCGRPLGLKFDKKGNLYVMDAYYGIFKVDVKTKKYQKLVDSNEPIEGKKPLITNSLDIASNGDIYWSDSCTDFSLQDGIYCMITNPSGRLIRYNAATKKNQVLVHDLGFANGVALSQDESFVIVAETMLFRIIKYNIKGVNAGKREIFIEGLPGLPDNIYSDNKGGYLVDLVVYADSENPQLHQTLAPHPHIRRLMARLLTLLEAPFKCLQSYYPNLYTEKIIHYLGSFDSVMFLIPKIVTVLRINSNGQVVDAAYSSDGKIDGITSAYIHDGFLWLGSTHGEYISRVPLKQAFPDLDIQDNKTYTKSNEKKVEEKSSSKVSKQPKANSIDKTPEAKKLKSTKADSPRSQKQ